jgi:hypothetical protein
MSSFGVFNQQVRRVGVLVALLFATVAPALVPSLAAAATVTERSIALSSSSKSATGVTYTVNFKPTVNAGAFVVDFCSDTPVIGEACTAPTGFSIASASSSTAGFTDVAEVTNGGNHNTLRVVGSMTAGNAVSVDVAGVANPSVAGTLYARVLTYANETNAEGYESADPDAVGAHLDEGGLAVSITNTVGVSGAVLESLTFCAAKSTISANCDLTGNAAPTLKLGETVPGTTAVALDSTHVSTGDMYTQISTNAVGGAIVSLKSGVTCGGLKRVEATGCDITPAVSSGISAGDAKFGVKATAVADTGSNPAGTFQAVNSYGSSTFLLHWVSGNATGVGSVYGDPILDTDSAPANNKNMKLTFGASVSNSTPAGIYSADLSLIATGKF